MKPLHGTLLSTCAALTVSPLALAHGGEHGDTVYHYLSSPDHLIVFGMLAMATLGACLPFVRRARAPARQGKRPPC